MSEDWLDIGEPVPVLPTHVELPAEYPARIALMEQSWNRLEPRQKIFLAAYRDCRFNERAACRQIGLSENTKPNTAWMRNPDYALVVRVWRSNAAIDAIDRDRLLVRQDDIVEALLTPKPIFHQGLPVVGENGERYHEIEAAAAGKANEVLMKAAGMLKDKEIEVNVGVVIGPPTLNIQVMPTAAAKAAKFETVAIDAKFTEVPDDDGWLDE